MLISADLPNVDLRNGNLELGSWNPDLAR